MFNGIIFNTGIVKSIEKNNNKVLGISILILKKKR